MRRWPGLVFAGAGGLVLLVVLVLRSPDEPVPRTGGQADHRRAPERRGEPGAPGTPQRVPLDAPTGAEETDDRLEPIPGTERWHYEQFLRLAAADPDGFERLADEKTSSGAPLEEQVALLRAAWKFRGSKALRWFSEAFAAGAGRQDGAADALRGFVVRHLASRAPAVFEVRGFLWEKVFLDEAVSARHRSAAGRAVLEAADPGEIPTWAAAIRGVSDPDVAEGALVGLGLNEHAEAASALTWLADNHPGERVRDRAAEVSRQRLTGNVRDKEED